MLIKLNTIIFFLLLAGLLSAQNNDQALSYNMHRFNLEQHIAAEKINSANKIDLQPLSSEKKSVGKALLYSLLLPGAGEFYVGNSTQGKIFLGLEVIAWGSLLFNNHYFNSLQRDNRTFATTHAALSKNGKDSQYWISIGKFDDIYDYNEQRRRDRRIDDVYNDVDEYFWEWDNQSNRLIYDKKRLDAVNIKDREVYFITGIILNHLVSAINAVRLARKHNKNLAANNSFEYHFVVDTMYPGQNYFGLSLAKRF